VRGFGELDVQGKSTVVVTCVFVAVAGLIAWSVVKQLKIQNKLEKRMGLGDDPAGS
jgi:hypothetical protein